MNAYAWFVVYALTVAVGLAGLAAIEVWREHRATRRLRALRADLDRRSHRAPSPQCGECRLGLGVHNTADPLCEARSHADDDPFDYTTADALARHREDR